MSLTSPSDSRVLIESVIETLQQGETLLTEISDQSYTQKVSIAFNASMGGHYRHCLDHFRSLLDSAMDGDLNYDHRERDTLIEKDRFAALNATRELREGFERLDPIFLLRPLAVTCKTSYATNGSQVSPSTIGREIMYSVAHAVSLRAHRRHGRNHGIEDASGFRRRAVHAQAPGRSCQSCGIV